MDTALTLVRQPDSHLVDLWLYGRSPHTQRAYRTDIGRFLEFVDKPLADVTLADLQAFADTLGELAPSSRGRRLASVKSLLSYGQRLGLLPVNAGAALRIPASKNTLAERILPEADVQRMLALGPNPRDRAMLRLLYAGGLRVSEACDLCWRDLQPREEGGQVNVYGKGQKTRTILLPATVWRELIGLRRSGSADDPVFRSQKGGPLDPSEAWRIVRAAARRAGIVADVSPHWLRHAHASHALDRGAPIHLVQATLGHASVATTGRYLHARPSDSSARYLAV